MQAKFTIDESQMLFLKQHRAYGFKDRSSMLRAAIEMFYEQLELQRLRESADLIAELYDDDQESQQWVEDAISGWPQ